MEKKYKIFIGSFLGLALLAVAGFFILNSVLVNKIRDAIATEIPGEFKINDYDIRVNSLSGSATISELRLKLDHPSDSLKNSLAFLEKASLNGLSYWDYVFSDKISFNSIKINGLDITFYKDTNLPETTKDKKEPFDKRIGTRNFSLEKSSILLEDNEGTVFKVSDLNFHFKNVFLNSTTLKEKIPIQFSDPEVHTGALKYRLNPYDMLSFKQLSLMDQSLEITDMAIKTIYSREELSRILQKEKDHMDLTVPSVHLRDVSFVSEDATFQVTGKELIFKDPVFTIYRDKLVADDNSIKPLYSKSLRSIPFPLTLDSLFIKNASITYEERAEKDQPPGRVHFSELNTSAGNVSNTYASGEKKTTINVSSLFMGNTGLNVDWSFDVNDPDDKFNIKGDLGEIDAAKLNSFTKSHLGVRMEGTVTRTFFNINGDNDNSHIDFRINYHQLKVEVLSDKNEKRWLPSAVANVFVSKSSANGDNDFKTTDATVERNKDKSFFNYLWINIMEGLKKVLVNI